MEEYSPWKGRADAGGREYTDDQEVAIRSYMQTCIGIDRRVPISRIESDTTIPGRTIRAILSDIDGVDLGIGTNNGDVFIAEYQEELEAHSWKLAAIIKTLQDRLDRRERFKEKLPQRQPGLFQ